jgi:replicative DNA helicase
MPEVAPPPRTMPQSPEAEVAVLGSILLNPTDTLDACLEQVTAEFFYQRSHRILFETIAAMNAKGEPIDTVTVTTRLKDAGKLEEIGGAYYISKLSVSFPTASNVEFYLNILKEKYQLRKLIEVAGNAIQLAHDAPDEIENIMDQVERDILKVCEGTNQKEVEPISEITERMIFNVQRIQENRGKLPGLSWGFRELNKITMGLRSGEMIVIAARPGIGKTSIALNVAEKLVLEEKIPVGVFSLEMTAEQLALRMACSKARVNAWKLYEGGMSERSLQDFVRASGLIGNSPLHILDQSQITIAQLRASARRLKVKHDVKLLIIDYLQLMQAGGMGRNDNREREVAAISGGIKALSKELEVPIIVLCQLNRDMERDNRKPRLSDLRESGAIEQDADMVCLLARDPAWDSEAGKAQSAVVADLIVAKNRNGPVGEVKLTYLADYTRFEDHTSLENG